MKNNKKMTAILLAISTILMTQMMSAKDFRRKSKSGPMAAVVDFENKSGWGTYMLGKSAADVLATELVKRTSLRCMEREKLDAIMREKNLSASGLVTPDSYVKMGGLLGVKYIVTGAVTEFGEKKYSGFVPHAGGSLVKYRVAIDVRIVDTTTGEIVFSESTSATKFSPRLRVKNYGGGVDYDYESAAKVLRKAAVEMAKKIEAALE